jgi:hypothetical protein
MMTDPDPTPLDSTRCAARGTAHDDADFASGYVTMRDSWDFHDIGEFYDTVR